tara:strand:- start:11386 stop:12117 length:732 start_codon:yes stop_codon:yes gene_type:complete
MRIYKNCKEAIKEIERDMFEMGIEVKGASVQDKNIEGDPDYFTKELSPYDFMILDQSDKYEMMEYMFPDEKDQQKHRTWLMDEFLERISREENNPGKAWEIRSDVWREFLHYTKHGQKFAYTYSDRFQSQLDNIIKELKEKPSTRQAILEMYNSKLDMENWGGKARIPCTMHYQMVIREGKLDLIYVMRSSDFLTHFANDQILAMEMQKYIANEVGVEPGKYTFFTGSLHCFQRDLKSRGVIF